jgi:hypothetical protein
MPSGQCSSRRLNNLFRLTARDDKLWAKEGEWAQHHGMMRMRCPYNRCAGKVKLVLLATIQGGVQERSNQSCLPQFVGI